MYSVDIQCMDNMDSTQNTESVHVYRSDSIFT